MPSAGATRGLPPEFLRPGRRRRVFCASGFDFGARAGAVGSAAVSETGDEDAGEEDGAAEEGAEDLGLRVMKGMWASIRSCRGCEKGAGSDESARS